jgi:hypothetical protein
MGGPPSKSEAERVARVKANAQRYCKANPEKRRALQRSWSSKNPVQRRYLRFRGHIKKYGIDVEDWARLFNAQDGRCAICTRKLDGGFHTHVDHDHETKKIRGLLCHGCNTSIGHLAESPDILRRAIVYLEMRHDPPNAP